MECANLHQTLAESNSPVLPMQKDPHRPQPASQDSAAIPLHLHFIEKP